MAGLINYTAKAAPTQTAAFSGATNIAPAKQTQWNVDKNQTVQGQLTDILAQESKMNQFAASKAMQQANKRGLTNSSIAVGEAQNAVIQNALPIAQQDAQTFGAAAQTNSTEANKIGMFNVGEANTTSRLNATEKNKLGMFNVGEANTTSKFNVGEANKAGAFNAEQAGVDDRFTRELASTEKQFNISEQNKMGMFNKEIASKEAMLGRQLTSEEKRQLIDVASREKIAGQDIASKEKMFAKEIASKEAMLGRQLTSEEKRQLIDVASREKIAAEDIASKEAMLGRQLTSEEKRQMLDIASKEQMFATEISSKEAMLGRQLTSEEKRQVVDLASRERLATQDLQSKEQMFQQEIASKEAMLGRQLTSEEKRQMVDISAKQQMFNAEQAGLTQRQMADLQSKEAMFSRELTSKEELTRLAENNDLMMQNLDLANKEKLAEINTSYQTLVEQNRGAAQLYDTYQKAINGVLLNPDLTPESKQSALDMQLGMLGAGMRMYSDVDSLDIGTMLDFANATNILAGGTSQPVATAATTQSAGLINTPASTATSAAIKETASLVNQQQAWDAKLKELSTPITEAMFKGEDSRYMSNTQRAAYQAALAKQAAERAALGPRPA